MLTSRAPSSWSLSPALLALLLSAVPARAAENVRVTAGTIDDDRRTSAKFGGGLELELKLTGDGLEGARAARGDEKQADAMMALAKGLMSMMGEVGENDLVLSINDPDKRIFDIEVASRDGKTIESHGSMSSGDVRILNFREKLPADAKLRIFLK